MSYPTEGELQQAMANVFEKLGKNAVTLEEARPFLTHIQVKALYKKMNRFFALPRSVRKAQKMRAI